jgi:hypothetical protein
LACGLAVALLIFLLVPLTQMFRPELRSADSINPLLAVNLPPPPPPPEDVPPPPESQEEPPPELKTPPPMPTLEQLEVGLNPGVGGDFTIGVGLDLNFQTESAEQMMDIFGFDELDQFPYVVSERSIIYPRGFRPSPGVGKAKLLITVDMEGRVQVDEVLQCSHRELIPAILVMAAGTRFSVPLKDGKPVRATYEWPLIIPLGR